MASVGKRVGVGGVFGGAEEKPSLLITEHRSSLLIRAAAFFTGAQMQKNAS